MKRAVHEARGALLAGAGAAAGEDGAFLLDPAAVRRADTSARSVNEWTGERTLRDEDIPDDVLPADVQSLGNYAVQITWQDGFNQVAPFEVLRGVPRMTAEQARDRALDAAPEIA